MVGMTTNERKIQEAINQQLDSTSKKIDEIKKQKLDAAGRGMIDTSEFDRQIEAVKKIGDESAIAARKIEESSIQAQRAFEFGWNKAFAQYAEDAGNYGKMAEDMFSSFTGNMNSALDTFVETGKLSFGDLAQSIIKDLIKIQLRMLMMQGISSMFGGMGGMFGGGGPQEVSAVTTYIGTAYADGGNPPVGVPSLVGERGPELFIPRSSGTIIPNNKLGDALGGSGVTYNGPVIQNMSAIDTQSGIQFLAKNKMTIWSMNQSANRSIPAGR
jgi:lambda family phage tail tape measure protein